MIQAALVPCSCLLTGSSTSAYDMPFTWHCHYTTYHPLLAKFMPPSDSVGCTAESDTHQRRLYAAASSQQVTSEGLCGPIICQSIVVMHAVCTKGVIGNAAAERASTDQPFLQQSTGQQTLNLRILRVRESYCKHRFEPPLRINVSIPPESTDICPWLLCARLA